MPQTEASGTKRKIAVLGGGMGSIAAVYCLTSIPNWKDKYEITVYQMGWRLGGKGASGRNPDIHDRIEEHGVHVFMGMYHNLFRVLRDAYKQLNRPASDPLSTCFPSSGRDAAFQPFSYVTFMEKKAGRWDDWNIDFWKGNSSGGFFGIGRTDGFPGSGRRGQPTIVGLLLGLLKHIRTEYSAERNKFVSAGGSLHIPQEEFAQVRSNWSTSRKIKFAAKQTRGFPGRSGLTNLDIAIEAVENLEAENTRYLHKDVKSELGAVESLLESFLADLEITTRFLPDDRIRRLKMLLRTGVIAGLGMLRDGVLFHGFDHLDSFDFKEWLIKHGAREEDAGSPLILGIYELVLGFDPQDRHLPNIGAGTTLRGILRLFLDYDGSIMWKMQAGMGDTVFTPLYQVLKNRGVTFKFFHRVTGLDLTEDGKAIGKIGMARQVDLEDENGNRLDPSAYDPLISVPCKATQNNPMLCWPSVPVYTKSLGGNREIRVNPVQAEELKRLKKENLDLESAWIHWTDPETFTLKKGTDFDDVILGIAVGALPYLTEPLMNKSQRWRKMVTGLTTHPTQAAQFWLNKTAADMCAHGRSDECMISSFNLDCPTPWPSWVGMTHLEKRENWPTSANVQHIGYLYTQINKPPARVSPPFTNDRAHASFPREMEDRVKEELREWITGQFDQLWSNGFDWDILVNTDATGSSPADPLDGQYVRINMNPSDRYVTHSKDTLELRIHAGESGFNNLFLAGDWTRNGLNSGCAEGATMSGMQAARAICGQPIEIYWETDQIGILKNFARDF